MLAHFPFRADDMYVIRVCCINDYDKLQFFMTYSYNMSVVRSMFQFFMDIVQSAFVAQRIDEKRNNNRLQIDNRQYKFKYE